MRFTLVEGVAYRMFPVWWRNNRKIRLEQAVTKNAQAFEHRTAQNNRIDHRSAGHILDDVRLAGFNQHFAHRLNQTRPLITVAVALGKV